MNRQYIGARYVPLVYENTVDPSSAEWQENVNYEPMIIVTFNLGSYMSKKYVPASVGNPAENPDYWVQMGQYNGQIAHLQSEIDALDDKVDNITVTPELFGAKGDGIADDTDAVQSALNSGCRVYLKNTYLVSVSEEAPFHHGLVVPNGCIIEGSGTLKLNPNDYSNYDILYIPVNSDNVRIKDITIYGDSLQHTGNTGEWGFGINVDGGNNVVIENVTIDNCWGDGILIGNLDDTTLHNGNNYVTVKNCKVTNNGRNNISVSHGKNIVIDGCDISGAYRTAPRAGIDVEPDSTENVNNCVIVNNFIHDNSGSQVSVNDTHTNSLYRVTINNNIIKGVYGVGGFVYGGGTGKGTIVSDNIIETTGTVLDGSQNFACVFKNNLVKYNGSSIPVKMSGANAVINDNVFEVSTTESICISFIGCIYGEISNNTFSGVPGPGFWIDTDADCEHIKISKNKVSFNTGACSGYIRINSTKHITVIGNEVSDVNPPVYFIQSLAASGTEFVAFNNAYFTSSFEVSNTVKKAANILNGTYTE